MKLITHKGGTFASENALETMIAAARMGADGVLLNDIQMVLRWRNEKTAAAKL